MKALVIYHADCFDGFTAAWVWQRFFGPDRGEFWPAKYGEPAPIEQARGRRVWVLDFSYPRGEMLALADAAKLLTVLDHHKTAEAALAGLDEELRSDGHQIVFDMKRSGAGIAWDFLFGQEPSGFVAARPELVDRIEERDLWKPHDEAIAAWVSAVPMTFAAWDDLAADCRPDGKPDGLNGANRKGQNVLAYIEQYGRKARAEQRPEWVGGYRVPTMNLPYMNCSEHVGKLLDEHPEAQFAVGYFRRKDGLWQFSLRSRPDFDCSKIAQAYGGGGHQGAAGFQVAELPWEDR